MIDLYDHFQTEAGKKVKAGWKVADITYNLANARKNNENPIKDNPFKYIFI